MEELQGNSSSSRASRRFVPRNSAMVAIHDDDAPFAFGVVTNISPSGACVVTTTPLPTGSNVFLKVSFYRQPEMLETRARVIWSREDRLGNPIQEPKNAFLFHGVHFYSISTRQRSKLYQLLDSSEFQVVFAPGSGEFESLMNELSDDLKRLGAKFEKETGLSN